MMRAMERIEQLRGHLRTRRHAPRHHSWDAQLQYSLKLLVALLVFVFGANHVLAQTTGQGIISGVITDPVGASVQGATITVTNTDTNVAINVVTNDTGYYEVRDLNPGPYEVSVTAQGFERVVRPAITLFAGQNPTVDLTLKVGSSSQTITVSGAAPLIETQEASIGQVLTSEEMSALPNGQAPIWLGMLSPGVQTNYAQNYQLGGADPSWNGAGWNFGANGRTGANEYSIDGAPNAANERTQAINLSPEETGQTAVTVNAFDAQVGHTYGINVTQTTKSGTNEFHGGIRYRRYDLRWFGMQHFQRLNYQYHQQADNCASNPGSSTCQLDQTQYGWPGTHSNYGDIGVGGPVFIPRLFDFRNRLFFFVGVTIGAPNNASSQTYTMPSALEKQGNFSDLTTGTTPTSAQASLLAQAGCPSGTLWYGQYQIFNPYSVTIDSKGTPRRLPFCGNVIPSGMISKLSLTQLVNSSLPSSNTGSPSGSNNYVYVPVNWNTYRAVTNRYDLALSNSDHVFFRWTRSHYWQHAQQFETGGLGDQYGEKWIRTGALGWSHVLSSKTLFDVTVGATEWRGSGAYWTGLQKYKLSDLGLPTYMDDYAGKYAQFPILQINGYQQIGDSYLNSMNYRTLAIRGNLISVQGSHSLRAGAEWRQQNVAGGGPTTNYPNVGPSGLFKFDSTYTQQNDGSDTSLTGSAGTLGLSYAAFLLGVQTNSQVSTVPSTSRSNPYYAFYVGDTWRVNRKLTLIPGIRYEFEYGPTEKHNRQIVGWDPNAQLTIASLVQNAYQSQTLTYSKLSAAQKALLPAQLTLQGGPIYAGVNGASTRQWENNWRVLPRIGVAYAINSKTVLRAGAGYFFDTLNTLNEDRTIDSDGFSANTGPVNSTNTTGGTDFVQSAPPLTNPFPVANGSRFASAVGNSLGADYYAGTSSTIGIYDHNRVPARSQRVQVSFERQLGNSTVIQVAYIGSRTTNITLDGNNNNTRSNSAGFINASAIPAQFFTGGTQPNTQANSNLGFSVPNPFNINNLSSLKTSNPALYDLLSHSGNVTRSTVPISWLVHPNPHVQSLRFYNSIGTSQFQEFQANLSKRMASGLVANVSYQRNYQKDRDYFMNTFDTHPSVESTTLSPPWRLTASWVYSLPFGKTRHWAQSGWKNAAFGGFTLSGTFETNPGTLLTFASNGSGSGGPNLFYIGDMNRIRLDHWTFNTSGATPTIYGFNTQPVSATYNSDGTCTYSGTGFVEGSIPDNPILSGSTRVSDSRCLPNSYNLRAFPIHLEGVRSQGINNWNMNLGRTFNLGERLQLEARADIMNALNHQRIAAVGGGQMNPTDSKFGQITSDNGNSREILLQTLIKF